MPFGNQMTWKRVDRAKVRHPRDEVHQPDSGLLQSGLLELAA